MDRSLMEHTARPGIDTSKARQRIRSLAELLNRTGEAAASMFPRMDEGGSLGYDEDGNLVGGYDPAGQVEKTIGFLMPTGTVSEAAQGARALGGGTLKAITAWHGSPHKFDKFSLSKIGAGEGAQAYGHGLYFAENKNVADEYAGKLSRPVVLIQGKELSDREDLSNEAKGFWEALESLAARTQYQHRGDVVGNALARAPASMQKELGYRGMFYPNDLEVRDAGNLYKTSLEWPDSAREAADPLGPQHFLDWDKPLSEQPETVRQAIQKQMPPEVWDRASPSMSGRQYYEHYWAGGMGGSGDGYTASRRINDLGIPGIKYLDGGSRGTGQGTSNYVIFDDSLAKILERNGVKVER